MYEIISMFTKYIFTVLIYMFIFKIAKLIYIDIKTMTTWEDSKVMSVHFKLLSSVDLSNSRTVTEIYPITNSKTLFGRSVECEIILADPHISSKHMCVEKDDDEFKLKDLGSANGTFVNDVRVKDSLVLEDGDKVRMGSTILVFSSGGSANV